MPIHDRFQSVLEAAGQGAEWAWARLIGDLDPTLRGYVRRQGGTDVDDVVSETWLHVARGLRTFSGDEAAFRSWVFMVAHHRIIDERRRLSRRPTVNIEETGLDDVVPHAPSAESEALERVARQGIDEALGSLTDDQREAVLLRFVVGLGVTEVARIVGRSPGAVRTLLRRALRRLERNLGEGGTFSA